MECISIDEQIAHACIVPAQFVVSLIVVCRDRVSRLIVTLGGGGGGGRGGGCSPTSISQLFDVLWAGMDLGEGAR